MGIRQCIMIWLFCWSVVTGQGLEAYSVHLPPKISLQIPEEVSVEGRDIPLYIIVDHMARSDVAIDSFLLDDKKLKVEAQQEEKIAPEGLYKEKDEEALIVNRYRAILPKRPSGIYNIGPVTVLVGGVRYSSDIITLAVQAATVSKAFRLEEEVDAPPKIFPGQTVTFEYRIFFQGSMQILREDLPLMSVQGFLTSNAPTVSTKSADKEFVQVITQTSRAVTPGAYESGVSTIEGMRMQGSSVLIPPLYRAQAPSKTITVLPFPDAQRPRAFDGALGAFVWRVVAANANKAMVGEPLRVEYRVSGRGELSTVRFPSFSSLPGLTDSFWTDASPPIGEEIEGTKTFVLAVRPKRIGPVEVPGFFFVSFDPYSEQYLTSTVPPVKLMVGGSKEAEAELAKNLPVANHDLAPPFELNGSSVSEPYLSPVWLVIGAFGCVGIGLIQLALYRYFKRQGEKKLTSRDLFYRAVMSRSKREKGLQLLEQAFYAQLYEKGLTSSLVDTPEAIPGEGIAAEARTLLQLIDRQLYMTGETRINLQEIYDEASSLYYRIKNISHE